MLIWSTIVETYCSVHTVRVTYQLCLHTSLHKVESHNEDFFFDSIIFFVQNTHTCDLYKLAVSVAYHLCAALPETGRSATILIIILVRQNATSE